MRFTCEKSMLVQGLNIASRTVAQKSSLPTARLPNSALPVAPIRKAELGVLDIASRRSHSSFDILPASNSETAHLAPIGKPQKAPSITGSAPSPLTPKSTLATGERSFPRSAAAPLERNISENTIKGKREGMTVLAQSESPFDI